MKCTRSECCLCSDKASSNFFNTDISASGSSESKGYQQILLQLRKMTVCLSFKNLLELIMQLTVFKSGLVKDVFHYILLKRRKDSQSIFNKQVEGKEEIYQDLKYSEEKKSFVCHNKTIYTCIYTAYMLT